MQDVSTSAVFSDTGSCVVAVHRGHVSVHKNEAIVVVILIGFLYLVKCLLAVVDRVNYLAYLNLIFLARECHHDIVFEGDEELNKIIVNSLLLEKNEFDDNLNELYLKTNYSINEVSKNSKGQVEAYRSNISIEVIISKNIQILKNKKIEKNFSYNDMDNRIKLLEYQNNVKNNIVKSSLEEIILFFNLK